MTIGIERTASTMSRPVWQQIRDDLIREIAEGRFTAGARLPSEAALAIRFGVNRHTVRRALGAMQADGLVHARRGAGVFVMSSTVPYRIGPEVRFTRNLNATGHSGSRDILRLETVGASPTEASELGLTDGDRVHVMESVGRIDGVPATHGRSVFPAATLPDLSTALAELKSVTAALAACGVGDYRRAWTRLTAERVSGTTARHLLMQDGAPVMRAVSLNTDPDGAPVEFAHTWFCADRVELVIDAESFSRTA